MPLTGATIHDALAAVGAIGGQITSYDTLAAGANGALAQAPRGLTVNGAAAFLATMAEESAHFRTTTEYGSGQSYAPYIGRTFEQITWPGNYRAFGAWCAARGLVSDPNTFYNHPSTLSDLRWAWLGGVWYFAAEGLWNYANAGDFLAVSQGVNGGVGRIGTSFIPNGWTERKALYASFQRAGAALLPASTSTSNRPVGTDLVDNIRLTGKGSQKIGLDPPGAAVISAAWLSAIVDGPAGASATATCYPQHPGGGTMPEQTLAPSVDQANTSSRPFFAIAAGTDQINVQYDVPEGATLVLIPAFRAAP